MATTAITTQQIDQVAEEEGWFRPEFDQPPFTLILQYLAGDLSLEDAVKQLTDPINASYSTADSGNAIRAAEATAAHQRTFFSSEDEGRAQWGDPLPESEIPRAAPEGTPSTEGQLWEVWYAILHASKRIPWQNDGHSKLVALVAAIKRVPDPPLLVNATKALRNDWIWEAVRVLEGCHRSVANVNAFVAYLTAEGVRNYSLYAIWAMRDALEERREEAENWLDATVPAAAAWIGVWGKEMYTRREDLTPTNPNQGNPARPGDYMIQRTNNTRAEWSPERWAFWKLRFEEIVGEEVSDETKAIAKAAFERMEEIEQV